MPGWAWQMPCSVTRAFCTRVCRYVRYQEHSFVALNTAFIDDDALFIPKGAVVEEPIYLVFVSTGQYGPVASPNLIVVGREAKRIVEIHIGAGSGAGLNAVTEVFGGEGASIDHYLLQREGDAGFHIRTLRGAVEPSMQLCWKFDHLGRLIGPQRCARGSQRGGTPSVALTVFIWWTANSMSITTRKSNIVCRMQNARNSTKVS